MSHPPSASPVVLITGSSSGFGLLTCVELARRGWRVYGSLRDPNRADRLLEAARSASVSVETIRIDVTIADTIASAVGEIVSREGRIDGLVNNAGFGFGGFLHDLSMEELREQFEANFFGAVAVTKAVLPQMIARRSGRIVNVASIGGRIAIPGLSAYNASKFALEGLTESLHYELRPFGVWAILVEPGTYKTDIFSRNKRMAAATRDPGSPYAAVIEPMERLVDRRVEQAKADPREVALSIARALTARRPRLRYLVGTDAKTQAALRWALPRRAFEEVVHRMLLGRYLKP